MKIMSSFNQPLDQIDCRIIHTGNLKFVTLCAATFYNCGCCWSYLYIICELEIQKLTQEYDNTSTVHFILFYFF